MQIVWQTIHMKCRILFFLKKKKKKKKWNYTCYNSEWFSSSIFVWIL